MVDRREQMDRWISEGAQVGEMAVAFPAWQNSLLQIQNSTMDELSLGLARMQQKFQSLQVSQQENTEPIEFFISVTEECIREKIESDDRQHLGLRLSPPTRDRRNSSYSGLGEYQVELDNSRGLG